MTSKLQHLQLAKPHLSTHVESTKPVSPNLLVQGTRFSRLSPYTPRTVLGFQGKALQLFYSFSSFSFLFLLEDFIGPLFLGALNLLQVVNITRVGFGKLRRLES